VVIDHRGNVRSLPRYEAFMQSAIGRRYDGSVEHVFDY